MIPSPVVRLVPVLLKSHFASGTATGPAAWSRRLQAGCPPDRPAYTGVAWPAEVLLVQSYPLMPTSKLQGDAKYLCSYTALTRSPSGNCLAIHVRLPSRDTAIDEDRTRQIRAGDMRRRWVRRGQPRAGERLMRGTN